LIVKYHANALQFLKDAEILFNNASYGHSYALLVLGFEEWAKTSIGFELLTGFRKGIDMETRDLLKEHTLKHEIGLASFMYILRIILLEESEMKTEHQQLGKRLKKGEITEKNFEEEFLRLVQQDKSNAAKTYLRFHQGALKDWSNNRRFLNDRKLSGLYVDVNKRSIASPQDVFSEEEVKQDLLDFKMIVTSTNGFIEILKDPQRSERFIEELVQWGKASK